MKHYKIWEILAAVVILIGVSFIFCSPFNDWSGERSSDLFSDYGSFAGALFSLAGFILLFLTLQAQREDMKRQEKQYERDKFISHFFELLKIHQRNAEVVANSELKTHDSVDEPKSPKSGFEYFADMITAEYKNKGYMNKRRGSGWDTDINLDVCRTELFKIISNYLVVNDNLGLYFRHLFMLVKFVVQRDDILSYENKRDYLSIVRALMSESEQICLYYYWVSRHDSDWENDKNHFFTDYRMIYDVNPAKLASKFTFMKIEPFKGLLENKTYRKEIDRKDDCLFERESSPHWDLLNQ